MHNASKVKSYRFEKGTRYYQIYCSYDLFGLVVEKHWGRKQSKLGYCKTIPVKNAREALQIIHEIVKRRNARGYTRVKQLIV